MKEIVRFTPAHLMAGLLLLATISGCGGSTVAPQTASNAQRVPNSVKRFALAPGVKHVFVADAVFNILTVFDRDGHTRTLTGFQEPQLLTTDADGNLYVANTIDENVEVFAPPYRNKPTATISEQGQWPVDVAVAKDGAIAVINICQANGSQCGASGSVEFFANAHSTSPCATVSGGNKISRILAGAFDAHGTLYADGVGSATLGRITGECRATTLTALRADVKIHFAAGLQIDPSGNIALVDSGGPTQGTTIDVFAPPTPGEKRLKLLSRNPLSDSTVVASLALTKDGKHLYTAEPRDSLEYDYPGGGAAITTLVPPKADLIEGVAVTPAETP